MNLSGALPFTIVVVFAVAMHFAFIVYLVLGGFLAWRWPATIGLHIAVVVWGAVGLALGLPCPLTDLERVARAGAGMGPLPPEGFIEHYVTGVWYPSDLGGLVQTLVFVAVLGSWVGLRIRRRTRAATAVGAVF
ncbi:DUF2784 domain-containing protein [Mycolicibacterium pyrenivorans]|uniref:DUF2784 domain-containing protein n=1 Tax=Mycolicibacterium pyrenivorans TaxID=187102 RepID=UPI003556FCA0|nr:DUF2784 domain-containing protein [Mycolicibacterium pyrenivorans]